MIFINLQNQLAESIWKHHRSVFILIWLLCLSSLPLNGQTLLYQSDYIAPEYLALQQSSVENNHPNYNYRTNSQDLLNPIESLISKTPKNTIKSNEIENFLLEPNHTILILLDDWDEDHKSIRFKKGNGSGILYSLDPIAHHDHGVYSIFNDKDYPQTLSIENISEDNIDANIYFRGSLQESKLPEYSFAGKVFQKIKNEWIEILSRRIKKGDQPAFESWFKAEPGEIYRLQIPIAYMEHTEQIKDIAFEVQSRVIYSQNHKDRSLQYSCHINSLSIADHWSKKTLPDHLGRFSYEDELLTLGREQNFYIMPDKLIKDSEEHSFLLELKWDHPVLFRTGRREINDYLYEGLNQPHERAEVIQKKVQEAMISDKLDDFNNNKTSPFNIVPAMKKIAQDNTKRRGGIEAIQALKLLQNQSSNPDIYKKHLNQLKANYTGYRNLLPEKMPADNHIYIWQTLFPEIREKKDQEPVLWSSQLEAQQKLVATNSFVAASEDEELSYSIPKSDLPSTIRLAIKQNENSSHFQLSCFKDKEILWQKSVSSSSEDQIHSKLEKPQLKELALFKAKKNYPWKPNYPITKVSWIEIPWPPGANRISLKRLMDKEDSKSKKSFISIEYLDSNPFRLKDREYVEALQKINRTGLSLFRQQLQSELLKMEWHYKSVTEWELSQTWENLIRLLVTRYEQLLAQYHNPIYPIKGLKTDLMIHEKVIESTDHKNHLEAFEALSMSRFSDNTSVSQNSKLQMGKQLLKLGEEYLYRNWMLGQLLDPKNNDERDFRRAIFHSLSGYYQEKQDNDMLMALMAWWISQYPSESQVWVNLTRLLFTEGYYQSAIYLYLLLPEDRNPEDDYKLQLAAKREGWSYLESKLQNSGEQNQSESLRGDNSDNDNWPTEQQLRHLYEADSEPIFWRRWVELLDNFDGISGFQVSNGIVTKAEGFQRIYVKNRDLYSNYWTAKKEKPLEIQVFKKTSIELEIRPLHANSDQLPLDGTIFIKNNEQTEAIPFFENWPSTGLEVNRNDWKIGEKIKIPLRLSQGLHNLQIWAEYSTLDNQQKEMAVSIRVKELIPVEKQLHRFNNYSLLRKDWLNQKFALLKTLPKYRFTSIKNEDFYYYLEYNSNQMNSHEGSWKLQRWPVNYVRGELFKERSKTTDNNDGAFNLELGQIQWNQEQLKNFEVIDLYNQYKNGKLSPLKADQLFGELLKGENQTALGKKLHKKIQVNLKWERLTNVMESSGEIHQTIKGWHPESELLRVRKQLLSSPTKGLEILYHNLLTTYSFSLNQPKDVVLRLHLLSTSYTKTNPIVVEITVDNKIHKFQLNREAPLQQLSLSLPSGKSSLGLQIPDRIANQYVAYELLETYPENQLLHPEQKRHYFISTRQEPIQLRQLGPGRIRVHEFSQDFDKIKTFYLSLDEGWQTLQLKPSSGKSSLFRIFERKVVNREQVSTLIRPDTLPYRAKEYHKIDSNKMHNFDQALIPNRFLYDSDNMLAANIKWQQRRNTNEDAKSSKIAHFYEASFTHWGESPLRISSWQNRLYFRYFDEGEKSFGLRSLIKFPNQVLSGRLSFQSLIATQKANFFNQGKKWQHHEFAKIEWQQRRQYADDWWIQPKINFFVRNLSLNQDNGNRNILDRDVYSDYKNEHQHGFSIGSKWLWMPTRDTIYYWDKKLISNEFSEGFRPDLLSSSLGTEHLIGSVYVDLEWNSILYLTDQDRENKINRNRISLELDKVFESSSVMAPWRLGFNIDYRIENREWTGSLEISALLDKYQDPLKFNPWQNSFSELLREKRAFDSRKTSSE